MLGPAPKSRLWWVGPVVALFIVVLGVVLARGMRQEQVAEVQRVQTQAGGPTRSGRIVEPWSRLGGREWYLPNLERVEVVVPDRPHHPDEARSARAQRNGSLQRVRRFTVSTGSQRLRGGDPPETGRRILVLGDSTATGWGVDEAESWPRLLEARLRENSPDISVLNGGVPACPVRVMGAFCRELGPELRPDLVLWVRRPDALESGPLGEYAELARACADATGAPLWVLLPPVSTFDVGMAERYRDAAPALRSRLPEGIQVHELTDPVRVAQAGKGHRLEREGQQLRVVQSETGAVVLEAAATDPDIPPAILRAFEADPSLREWGFFDEGHLDAAGQAWMAEWVAEKLETAGLPAARP